MLKNNKAFSSFSVNDIAKAKEFYGTTLGLEITENPQGLDMRAGGNSIFIYPKDNHVPATFTVLNFLVQNIEETVDRLAQLGVTFEIYNEGMLKTNDKGISMNEGPDQGPRIAWFKDPAGNFLAVIEEE